MKNSSSPFIIGVRHHSPACAKLVIEEIQRIKPSYVLIEGPMDFNDRLDELLLPHTLPIAIYSYGLSKQSGVGFRHGSWTPFAPHSPEWQALLEAKAQNATIRFIDLPAWHHAFNDITNRYADIADHAEADYIQSVEARLCEHLGLTNSDALWDHLFEDEATPAELSTKLTLYFEQLRADLPGSAGNQAREAMMANWISWAMAKKEGPVLVVCGGYHAPKLAKLWQTLPPLFEEPKLPTIEMCLQETLGEDDFITGSYLVPYSYKRLDAFTGYASGMPSSLYQQWVFEKGIKEAGHYSLKQIFKRFRQLRLPASTADMTSIYLRVQALSQLRGHAAALRTDWLDAIAGSLIKDALEAPLPWTYRGTLHTKTDPILVKIMDVLAGGEIHGVLSPLTVLPPLLNSLKNKLIELNITIPSKLTLNLLAPDDKARSETLHQLAILQIPGIQCNQQTRLALSADFQETWDLTAPLSQQPALIEASIYGATVSEAALAKLEEAFVGLKLTSLGKIKHLLTLLNQAALAGLATFSTHILTELNTAISQENKFEDLGSALEMAYTLYRYGTNLNMQGLPLLLTVIQASFDRALWLCESYGQVALTDAYDHILAFKSIALITQDALAMTDDELRQHYPNLQPERTLSVWQRKFKAHDADPLSRGAALGGLLHLLTDEQQIQSLGDSPIDLLNSLPIDKIGDLLSGLLALSRDQIIHNELFISQLNELILSLSDGDFLLALPGMRGAFSWLPPRERGEMASKILYANNLTNLSSSTLTQKITNALPADIASMILIEKQALETLSYWGLIYEY